MLNGPDLTVGRTVITHDDGTFSVERLPAGRYTVGAVKDGYVPMNYGAKRSGRPGTSVLLRDGEAQMLTIRLPRGAVITGTIVDSDGQPAGGVPVNAMSHRFVGAAGERRLAPSGSSTTDDRGAYRIFGLPAGDYLIVAHARPVGPSAGELQVISQAEVRRALAEVRQTATLDQPGLPKAPRATAPTTVEPRRTVTLAPVFYPGTADAARAAPVTVGRGEERGGVDFQIQYVPTAIVSGVVSAGSTGPMPAVILVRTDESVPFETFRTTRIEADGRFTFNGVAPGKYTVMARSSGPSGLSAATEIAVDGEDVTGVGLMMQPGLTFSGRMAFEGSRPPPPDLAKLRIPLPAVTRTGANAIPLPAVQLETGGRFTMSGIVPGVYRFGNTMQGLRAPIGGWWLRSVSVGGRELLDGPLDLRQSATDTIVTFSDRATELAGTITGTPGSPPSDYVVIAFGVDKASWFTNSRRVAGVRPDAEGRYTIRNLPPGEYFVVVSDDVEQNEWFDATALQRLAPVAVRIVLGEDETKTFDFRVTQVPRVP